MSPILILCSSPFHSVSAVVPLLHNVLINSGIGNGDELLVHQENVAALVLISVSVFCIILREINYRKFTVICGSIGNLLINWYWQGRSEVDLLRGRESKFLQLSE